MVLTPSVMFTLNSQASVLLILWTSLSKRQTPTHGTRHHGCLITCTTFPLPESFGLTMLTLLTKMSFLIWVVPTTVYLLVPFQAMPVLTSGLSKLLLEYNNHSQHVQQSAYQTFQDPHQVSYFDTQYLNN